MDRKFITPTEAIVLLNDTDEIHTFRSPAGNVLLGWDADRQTIIDKINSYADKLEIGGSMCRGMKHGLVIEDQDGFLFVETNMEILDELYPQTQ